MNPWQRIQERTRAEHSRFRSALRAPRDAQRRQLASILAANADCALGRRCRFSLIRDEDEFRSRVPVHRYEDLQPAINATCDGAGAGLVSDPVVACERTSGTTTTSKIIPYTEASLSAFRRAIYPWLHELACHWPGLARGRAYLAISPAMRPPSRTAAGIPVGAQDDRIYFGAELGAPLEALATVPDSLARIRDLETWRYLTLRCLLDADDLTLISVWSPTFFTTLLSGLQPHRERLAHDLEQGRATAPDGTSLDWRFARRSQRARVVYDALCGPAPNTGALWPRLALISCWADGAAARFLPQLQQALPGVPVQGKGLLATEGVVSLPVADGEAPVLAVNSGFYEFLDERGESRLAHELEPGNVYRVLLTTHGGLYRYDLGDEVRVRGHVEATPMLEFVARIGNMSDLCGEKITESHVQHCLAGDTGFALLAPSLEGGTGYRLIVDRSERDAATARRLADRLERGLRANPQYDHARRIGQLKPVECERRDDALSAYLRWLARRGQRLGDIKPPVLYRGLDWAQMFEAD